MANMTMFDFDSEAVRAVMIDGDPWLVGRDVCRCLGLQNESQALSRLDDYERRDGVYIADALGRQQAPILVSEPGVYNLIFTSRTEPAERFKRWLAHDVLPSLRKTGRYDIPDHEEKSMSGRRTTVEVDPIDLDSAPIGQIRLAVSLLREVRIIFGTSKARKVARRITAISDVIGAYESRDGAGADIEMDDVDKFAEDMLIAASQSMLTAAEIWKAYRDWCRNNESAPVTQTMLGRRLRLMGYKKQASGGVVRYLGLAFSDLPRD